MLDFSQLDTKTILELVYDEIKGRILNGTFAPGDRILEVHLAEEMDVSRTPVREAVRQLETEGLVQIIPRKGAYVSRISGKRMNEILEVREDIEGLAAFYAAKRSNKQQKKRMLEASLAYAEAAACRDYEHMMIYNLAFHRNLIEASQNKILIQMAEKLQELITPAQYAECCLARAMETAAEHTQIIKAIMDGDAMGAQMAADHHIKQLRPQGNN